jgi:hypothetical protein
VAENRLVRPAFCVATALVSWLEAWLIRSSLRSAWSSAKT